MTRVTVDSSTIAKLHHLSDSLELCDEGGRLLGFFTPASAAKAEQREPSPLSHDELERRVREPGGRSIPEILADLSRRK